MRFSMHSPRRPKYGQHKDREAGDALEKVASIFEAAEPGSESAVQTKKLLSETRSSANRTSPQLVRMSD